MAVVTSAQCLNAMRACLRITKDEESNKGGIFTRYQKAMLNLHRHPQYAGIYEANEDDAYVISQLSAFQTYIDSQRPSYVEVKQQSSYAEELTM